jgi:conjugative relaxase-like TrwC/TraI family protein
VSYYTDRVAHGIEDYYAGRGEAEGEWLGAGAQAAGLQGVVTGDQLRALFEARHPVTGEPLGKTYVVPEGKEQVAGWDLTFSAPKSVSVLWAVGGGEIGMEVRDAHAVAVHSALKYLEEHAAFSRTGKAGVRQVDTNGLVAAGFVHRTSRSGDPQLHTHVLVSNRVQCEDGVWRALDGKTLHRQLKATGMLYHAALRAELTARLGVAWAVPDRHGQAEITGVPKPLRRLFSSRRAEVEAAAGARITERETELGRALTAAERRTLFEQATLETRHAKTAGVATDAGLHDRWHAEAEAAGYAPEHWIDQTLERHQPARHDIVAADLVSDVSAAASTWGRTDVVKVAARRAPVEVGSAEAARAWIEHSADDALAHPGVLALRAPERAVPDGLRRRDGCSGFERHDAARYTTTKTLQVEQRVLDLVTAGRAGGVGIADVRDVRRAICDAGLVGDVAAAAGAVTGSGDRVSVVVGPAGTGKTRLMAAAGRAWSDSGIPVRGLTVSAMAAGVLAAETGFRTDTIAKFLHEHDGPDGPENGWRLQRGEVVVIDEAGMVASADLARLLSLINEAHGKAVLVGDPAQLGAVEAGGLFRLLATDANTLELSNVRRFTHTWEPDTSMRLRWGHADAIDIYDEHGRIVGGDRTELEDASMRHWQRLRAAGQSLIITATDRATVSRLAEQIQRARVEAGDVQPDGITTSAGQRVGVGDEIVTLRNNRRLVTDHGLWVRNGDRWAVISIGDDGALAVSHLAGHGRTVLPSAYATEQVALAYAVTVHKAQGVTVDHAISLVDDHTTSEALYVGMTRGRNSNVALAVTDTFDADHHHRPPEVRDAVDVVKAAAARHAAEISATETLRRELERSESLAVLMPRLAHVNGVLAGRPADRSIDLQRIAGRRAQLEQHTPKLGPLTSRGREHRRGLDRLDTQLGELNAQQQEHDRWMAEHADTFTYRDQLIAHIQVRRSELGRRALIEQPEHLVQLIGAVPDNPKEAELWRMEAGRIEAFREQWNVPADRVHEAPRDGIEYREWADTVRLARDLHEIAERAVGRGVDRGPVQARGQVERGLDRGW